MKKISLSILAFIVLATTASAQVKFGGKAGINIAKLSGKSEGQTQNLDSKIGLHIGGLVEIPVTESFSVMPELNFDQLGGKDKVSTFETKLMMNYLSIPVLAKYNVGGLGIYAGPQVGLLLSAKAEVDSQKEDVKDQFKSTDFCAVFGAEYNLPYGIFVSARYNLGLTKITDPSTSDDYAKNRAITVAVGIKFGGSSGSAKK